MKLRRLFVAALARVKRRRSELGLPGTAVPVLSEVMWAKQPCDRPGIQYSTRGHGGCILADSHSRRARWKDLAPWPEGMGMRAMLQVTTKQDRGCRSLTLASVELGFGVKGFSSIVLIWPLKACFSY